MIRIIDDRRTSRRIRGAYRLRAVQRFNHQQELATLGGEEGIHGRDIYLTWNEERRDAFQSWANEMRLPLPFVYVEEFEAAFPAVDTTPERTTP